MKQSLISQDTKNMFSSLKIKSDSLLIPGVTAKACMASLAYFTNKTFPHIKVHVYNVFSKLLFLKYMILFMSSIRNQAILHSKMHFLKVAPHIMNNILI